MKLKLLVLFLIALLSKAHHINSDSDSLKAAIDNDLRTAAFKDRDQYRNPYKTLKFFGLEDNQVVVELSPGGGWYTEILAPYLKKKGELIAAHYNPETSAYYARSRTAFDSKIASNDMFSEVRVVELDKSYGAENSVDLVVTFRNLHNWIGQQGDDILSRAFKVLKPGGSLGVVDHRAKPGTSLETMKQSGYITEEYAISVAEKAGFILVASSEINANSKDTADYKNGVWTLPPSLRLKEIDKEKYLAIGESDRFTLLFKKPEK